MRWRYWTLLPGVGVMLLAACGGGGRPVVEQVRPDTAAPGGLVMVSGRGLDRVAAASLGGRPVAQMTAVNGGLLTLVVPADIPSGDQTLEVRSLDGARATISLRIEGTSGPAPVAGIAPSAPQTPQPVATPAPTPPPAPPPPIRVAAPPLAPPAAQRDDKKEQKDEHPKPGNGRGR